MRTSEELEAEALGILREAISRFGPRAVYVMFSGGNDSRTVASIVHPYLRDVWTYKGAALMDTGIALQEAHANVAAFASRIGCSLTVVRTPASYERAVREHGFPGAAQHTMMYRLLKERAIRILTRKAKALRRDKVMLVSGVRQQESKKRMLLTDPVQVDDARVWVNPCFYWTTEERDSFMETRGIERNPISGKICGSSGDCLCGAMAEEGELADLDFWYGDDPAVQRIHALQEEVRNMGVPCKWGHKPNGKPPRSRRTNRPMFLCVGCEAKAERTVAP